MGCCVIFGQRDWMISTLPMLAACSCNGHRWGAGNQSRSAYVDCCRTPRYTRPHPVSPVLSWRTQSGRRVRSSTPRKIIPRGYCLNTPRSYPSMNASRDASPTPGMQPTLPRSLWNTAPGSIRVVAAACFSASAKHWGSSAVRSAWIRRSPYVPSDSSKK